MLEFRIPEFDTKCILTHELPKLPEKIEKLYLDFETTSGDLKKDSLNPFKNCSILGAAVLWDDEIVPFYIPVRHYYLEDGIKRYRTHTPNAELGEFYAWIKELLRRSRYWINHNIKYDYHVLKNEIDFECPKLRDTLTWAKLSDMEEKFAYDLTSVCGYIGMDISRYEDALKKAKGKGIQDYGIIPPDVMAPYAGVDVLAVRLICQELSVSSEEVLEMENELLPVLIDMERKGIRIDPNQMAVDLIQILGDQKERLTKIRELSQYPEFEFGTKECLKELFIERLGWQVDLTPKENESFAYNSLIKHREKSPELLDTYLDYTEFDKLVNTFYLPYLGEHRTGDLIHPAFNQIVRTGRMSCKAPNIQQIPKNFKHCLVPYTPEHILVSFDLSQIEFRVIAHYIENRKCIADYNRDSKTDFHDWVAGMCGVTRKPAKGLNFMLGYGGGKDKCVLMLTTLDELIKDCPDVAERQSRAIQLYSKYHAALPELKQTQYRAASVCASRGYVRTLFGRRRYLPSKASFKAFNSICQGTAADIMKDITLRLRRFIDWELVILHALVHDCWLFSIHKSIADSIVPQIKEEIERPLKYPLLVPIVSSCGISDKNWKLCDA